MEKTYFECQPLRKGMVILIAMLSLLASLAPAQTITASITGTGSDPSGATVPNATVIATNTETNVHTTTTTNSDGIYNFPFLRVGPYTITVEAKGFKKSVLGPFNVDANRPTISSWMAWISIRAWTTRSAISRMWTRSKK